MTALSLDIPDSICLASRIGMLAGCLAMAVLAAPDSDFSAGESPTAPEEEIRAIRRLRPGLLVPLGSEPALDWMSEGLDRFHQDTGFRLGVAHTMFFGQPGGRLSDHSGCAASNLVLKSSQPGDEKETKTRNIRLDTR